MAYTTELTAKLTGASLAQLARFRTGGVLAPARIKNSVSTAATVTTRYDYDRLGRLINVFDAAGAPVHARGVTSAPGLYFLGLEFLFAAVSATLPGVGRDARYLADQIAARAPRANHPRSTVETR